jgi:hypothetical protein
MDLGHPDLTLVVVYASTGYGRFNSRGGVAQSVRVDPKNSADVETYDADLKRVYLQWGNS